MPKLLHVMNEWMNETSNFATHQYIIMLYVQCGMKNIVCTMFYVQYCMYNVVCTILYVQCCRYNVVCTMLYVQCCMYNVVCAEQCTLKYLTLGGEEADGRASQQERGV